MRQRRFFVPVLTAAITVGALLWIWTRFAEVWLPSVALYAGLVVGLAGLVSLIAPLKLIGIASRRAGALVALAGAGIAAGALLWPVPGEVQVSKGGTELDRVMPQYDRCERHEVLVRGSVEEVRRAAEEVTFADIRGLATLMSLRAGKNVQVRPAPVLATMTRPGGNFTLLAKTDQEVLAGNVGRPWRNERPRAVAGADEFRAFGAAGYAKIAFNMRVEAAEPGWCKVATETRVLGTDSGARGAFARYWRVVYPGSALIRVMWLDAIGRRLRTN